MKKLFISLTVLFVLVMSACSNSSTDKRTMQKVANQKQLHTNLKMVKVEVPANPKRVVVLSSFAGNVMSLGVNLVGVDSWSKQNPRFDSKLKDVAEVSDENVEKIAELNPDLIIGLSNVKNVDKLKENRAYCNIHLRKS